jgi:predicted nucleotidyltransferase
MKHQTAIKNLNIIADKMRRLSGLIGTPDADFEAFKITRAWLFGSVAKGSQSPKDIDILIEGRGVGRRKRTGRFVRINKIEGRKYLAKTATHSKRNSTPFPLSCRTSACRYLKGHLKGISFHDYEIETGYGDINETKIMIYPYYLFSQRRQDYQK